MPQDDRERLAAFLGELDEFVRHALPDLIQRATKRAETEAHPLTRLWLLQGPRIASAVETLRGAESDLETPLEQHGLVGRELELKLILFETAVEQHRSRPSPLGFRRALSAADVVLGSLSAVVPGLDAVKEAKEAVEAVFGAGRGLAGWLRRIAAR